jgi:predicted SAM-dependent methyltransferase
MINYSLPFQSGQKILELCGGAVPMFRPNMDIRQCHDQNGTPTVDIVADLCETFPIKDEEWDGVFSSFGLEHVSFRKTAHVLSETLRILKPNGTAVFLVPNTKAQMEHVLSHDEFNHDLSSMIFGDNDYPENTHRALFSPEYAFKLFSEAGFSDVFIIPWGDKKTDMLIEAKKKSQSRSAKYDKHYFNDGKNGGYQPYADFPINNVLFQKIMALEPKSVLDLGCGRGYLVKRFQDAGIPACGIEISQHCILTRACNDIVEHDLCNTPWPIDSKGDLIISIGLLEHLPEDQLPRIIQEMARIGNRGFHAVDLTDRSREWWLQRLPEGHEVIAKSELEKIDLSLIHYLPEVDEKLKVNVGCFTNQFYGWCNIDVLALEGYAKNNFFKFFRKDVREGLPFADKTVDLMYSSHFLEHLTYNEGQAFLKECRRVMKIGGTIRLMLPDLSKLIHRYQEGTLSFYDEINDGSSVAPSQAGKLWALLFSGHQACYDFATLKIIAEKAGFTQIRECGFRDGHPQILKETIDMLPELSLYVEITA